MTWLRAIHRDAETEPFEMKKRSRQELLRNATISPDPVAIEWRRYDPDGDGD